MRDKGGDQPFLMPLGPEDACEGHVIWGHSPEREFPEGLGTTCWTDPRGLLLGVRSGGGGGGGGLRPRSPRGQTESVGRLRAGLSKCSSDSRTRKLPNTEIEVKSSIL